MERIGPLLTEDDTDSLTCTESRRKLYRDGSTASGPDRVPRLDAHDIAGTNARNDIGKCASDGQGDGVFVHDSVEYSVTHIDRGDDRHCSSRGSRRGVESARVREVSTLQTKFGGLVIHFSDKAGLRAGNPGRKELGDVVSGTSQESLEELVFGEPFTRDDLD